MSDHLPECPVSEQPVPTKVGYGSCICPALRACEQRVRQDVIRENGDWIQMPTAALDQIKQTSYSAGLTAAREAVAALPWTSETWQAHGERAAVLAAIDALRTNTAPRISTGYDPTTTDNRP